MNHEHIRSYLENAGHDAELTAGASTLTVAFDVQCNPYAHNLLDRQPDKHGYGKDKRAYGQYPDDLDQQISASHDTNRKSTPNPGKKVSGNCSYYVIDPYLLEHLHPKRADYTPYRSDDYSPIMVNYIGARCN